MAPIGLKLGQNAFQTFPNISFFDPEEKNGEHFWSNMLFFINLARFSRSYEFLDVSGTFSMQNDP